MFERAKWCVKNPGDCARQGASSVRESAGQAYGQAREAVDRGRQFIRTEREAVGRKFETVAPQAAARFRERAAERAEVKRLDKEYKKNLKYARREAAKDELKNIKAAKERRDERQRTERMETAKFCAEHPLECENYKSNIRRKQLEQDNRAMQENLVEKRRRQKEKQEAFNNSLLGTSYRVGKNFVGFAYDEAKYAANIQRGQHPSYVQSKAPTRPTPNLNGGLNRKISGKKAGDALDDMDRSFGDSIG